MRHPRFARFAAPIALLAVVTIAVLLVRSALHHAAQPATTPTTATTRTTTSTPGKKRPPVHARTYTVRSGDTLGSIAQKTGTTVARLEQLNPGINPTALQVGQKIRVR